MSKTPLYGLNDLLENTILVSNDNIQDIESEYLSPGTQGFWTGPLSGVFLGVLLDSTTIQKYKEETILCPDGTLVVLSGYKAREIFKEGQFCYVERGNTINLKLE